MIGMRAVVMNGARIGSGSLVAVGAVIPEGVRIPPGSGRDGFAWAEFAERSMRATENVSATRRATTWTQPGSIEANDRPAFRRRRRIDRFVRAGDRPFRNLRLLAGVCEAAGCTAAVAAPRRFLGAAVRPATVHQRSANGWNLTFAS